MSDDRRFRSRDTNDDADRREAYVRRLLGALDKATRETDPSLGASSAEGKDLRAFDTLSLVGQLVRAVAGWAVDHASGLAVSETKLLPHPIGRSSEYAASRSIADDHRHEAEGGELWQKRTAPRVNRLIFRNLLIANPLGIPEHLNQDFVRALEALDEGEAVPILHPEKRSYAKIRFTERRHQLRALCFAHFIYKYEGNKGEARERVGRAYGISPMTITTWEDDVAKAIPAEFREGMRHAEITAKWNKHYKYVEDSGADLKDVDADRRRHDLSIYGTAALIAAGDEYKVFLKTRSDATSSRARQRRRKGPPGAVKDPGL